MASQPLYHSQPWLASLALSLSLSLSLPLPSPAAARRSSTLVVAARQGWGHRTMAPRIYPPGPAPPSPDPPALFASRNSTNKLKSCIFHEPKPEPEGSSFASSVRSIIAYDFSPVGNQVSHEKKKKIMHRFLFRANERRTNE